MRETKERILDAAEKLFALYGYDATSLRTITREAGVNLAAVNYHFSSKEALLRALFARRLGLLNEKRLAMLTAYEEEAGGQPVPLERILRAFLEPVLRLGAGTGFGTLVGRMYSWPSAQLQRIFLSEMQPLIGRFKAAFRKTLPAYPVKELYWRVFFCIGAMAHTLAGSSLLRALSGGACDPADLDGTVERMIAFLTAAFDAPLPAGYDPKQQKRGRVLKGSALNLPERRKRRLPAAVRR
jgi:AcrR family transcriptional regulator